MSPGLVWRAGTKGSFLLMGMVRQRLIMSQIHGWFAGRRPSLSSMSESKTGIEDLNWFVKLTIKGMSQLVAHRR